MSFGLQSTSTVSKLSALKSVRDMLSGLQASLYTAISDLEEEEAAATVSRRLDQRNQAHTRKSLESLPDHILIQIIADVMHDYDDEYQAEVLIPMSKLSRRLCRLVYSTSAFWTHVSTNMKLADVKRSLAFSKRAGLRIKLNSSSRTGPDFRACLSSFEEHRDRWKSLCLHYCEKAVLSEAIRVLGATIFSSVSSLRIEDRVKCCNNKTKDSVFSEWSFPSLTSLEIKDDVPPLQFMACLTRLEVRLPYTCDATRFLHILRSAPLLRELDVVKMYLDSILGDDNDDGGLVGTEPDVVELPQLERLNVFVSGHYDATEDTRVAIPALAWFTRAFKTPFLSSVTLECVSWREVGLAHTDLRFFPDDVDLQRVEHVRLLFNNSSGADFHDSGILADAILSRLPHVKKVELHLPEYAPLVHYVREYPSIRSLSMECTSGSEVKAAGFVDFVRWLQRGEHELDRFYLTTSIEESKRLVTRMEEYVGSTFVRWDDLVS